MPEEFDRCVEKLINDPDFKPKEGRTKKQAAHAVCTESYKKKHGKAPMEAGRAVLLSLDGNGHGPALRGAALTNSPFVNKLPQVTLTDGGMLRVPIFRKATFIHPWFGVLKFDQEFYNTLIKNFESRVIGVDPVINCAHQDTGALAWTKDMVQEDDLLVLMAKPTPIGTQMVEDEIYKYASAEFYFNFEGAEVDMSAAELEKLTVYDPVRAGEELAAEAKQAYLEEASMPPEGTTASPPADPPATAPPPVPAETPPLDVAALTAQLRTDLTAELQEQYDGRITALELRNEKLRVQAWNSRVDALLARAEQYRDEDGRAHAPPLLELADKALRGQPLGEGDGVVNLEKDGSSTLPYLYAMFEQIFQGPGTMPTEAALEGPGEGDPPRSSDPPDKEKLTEGQEGLLELLPPPADEGGDE